MGLWDGINKIMPYLFPVFLIGILFAYYFIDPLQKSFPIHCIWKDLTGSECPSCGTQRALHSLMHGEIMKALKYNCFFVISIPYAFLAVLCSWYNKKNIFDRIKSIIYDARTLRLYVLLYFLWWLTRNVLGI